MILVFSFGSSHAIINKGRRDGPEEKCNLVVSIATEEKKKKKEETFLVSVCTMALEALSSCNDLSNFIVHDTISAAAENQYNASQFHPTNFVFRNSQLNASNLFKIDGGKSDCSSLSMLGRLETFESKDMGSNSTTQGRKRRRRKPRVCKSKEEAETQRMTHIAVERNRRRLMNEHLSVLRSLMPESYIQKVLIHFHFHFFQCHHL